MLALIKYNYKLHIKTKRFIVFLLIYLAFISIYIISDKSILLESTSFCGNILYLISVLIGFKYSEIQDWRTEEIVYLKVQSKFKYWMSKVLFIMIVGCVVSLIGIMFTSSLIIFKGGGIMLNIVIKAFIFHSVIFSIGGILGMIFGVNNSSQRNTALMILVLISLLSLLRSYVIAEWPMTKLIMYIIPPINDTLLAYSKMENMIMVLCWCILYLVLEVVIYIKSNSRKMF